MPRAMTSTPEPAGKPMMMVTGRSGHEAAIAAVPASARPAPMARRRAAVSSVERGGEFSRFIPFACQGTFKGLNLNNGRNVRRRHIFCLHITYGNKGYSPLFRICVILKKFLFSKEFSF